MTPEERAVIEAALHLDASGYLTDGDGHELHVAIQALIESRQPAKCTCPPIAERHCQAWRCLAGVWIETTMTNALINDRIRIGAEETTVRASTHGMWHVDTRDPWFPREWQHVELRLDLEAVPGLKQYPPAASIEILCSPERLAVLRIQEGFPGSAVTSSHVD